MPFAIADFRLAIRVEISGKGGERGFGMSGERILGKDEGKDGERSSGKNGRKAGEKRRWRAGWKCGWKCREKASGKREGKGRGKGWEKPRGRCRRKRRAMASGEHPPRGRLHS
jgi:hypothetical protein